MKKNNSKPSVISSIFNAVSLFSYAREILFEIKIVARHILNDIFRMAFIGMLIQAFLLMSIVCVNLILFILLLDFHFNLLPSLNIICCLNLFLVFCLVYAINSKDKVFIRMSPL